MPMRVTSMLERNVFDMHLPAFTGAANTTLDALPDITRTAEEIVARYLFNAGGSNVYYRFGEDCDTVSNFNGWIAPGNMLNVETRDRVSVKSGGAITLGITQLKRDDLIQPGKNILLTGNPNP